MIIVSVLKSGPEYQPGHARWLHRQLNDYDTVCMTDCQNITGVRTTPLLYDFPAWWSKLEVFNPDHPCLGKEDLLLLDIDTVVTGDLTPFFKQPCMTTLTDFYHEHSPLRPPGSAVMYIPADIKAYIWTTFMASPLEWINRRQQPPFHGDQGFLASILSPARWQDVLPGAAVSYKKDIACQGMPGWHPQRSQGNGDIPAGTRLVCFHGKPRPWDTGLEWVPASDGIV